MASRLFKPFMEIIISSLMFVVIHNRELKVVVVAAVVAANAAWIYQTHSSLNYVS